MRTLLRCALIAGLIISASLASTADDPFALYQRAKEESRSPAELAHRISLLNQANTLWERAGSTDLNYARSLDLLSLLLMSRALGEANGTPSSESDAWARVAPLTRRALDIIQANQNVPPADKALALELEADAVGRSSIEGASFWKQASAIREQLVSQTQTSEPAESSVSESPGQSESPTAPHVLAPQLMAKREPEYTGAARDLRYGGRVLLSIVITKDGAPQDFELIHGLGGLDEQAALAVSSWRFRPAKKDGQIVAVRAQVEVNFQIAAN